MSSSQLQHLSTGLPQSADESFSDFFGVPGQQRAFDLWPVLAECGIGIFRWDPLTKKLNTNTMLSQLLDLPSCCMVMEISEIQHRFPAEDGLKLTQAYADLSPQQPRFNLEVRLKGHRSECSVLCLKWQGIFSESQNLLGIFGTCIVNSGQNQKEMLEAKTIHDYKMQAKMFQQELAEFCYSVSHDLKAPIRGIEGFSQILLEDYSQMLDASAQRYLELICAETDKMKRFIEGLLKLSGIVRAPLHRTQVNLSQLAEKLIAGMRENSAARPVTVKIQQGLIVTGDPGLLEVVLANLLENAWKFTSNAEIANIEFCVVPSEEALIYAVRDNGVGFDIKAAANLFAPFQRMHSVKDFDGIGMGLAQARRIIHRHGGKIWADSELNKGTTVFFTLR